MAQDAVDKFLLQKETLPRFGVDFPAKRITTEMNWEDVVLNAQTAEQVKDIGVWMQTIWETNGHGNRRDDIFVHNSICSVSIVP